MFTIDTEFAFLITDTDQDTADTTDLFKMAAEVEMNIERKTFILMTKIIGLQPRPDLEHERVPGQGLRWRPPLHRPQPRQHPGGRVREDAQGGDASVQ